MRGITCRNTSLPGVWGEADMRGRGVMITCPGLPLRYDWSSDCTLLPYIYITRNPLSGKWVLPYNGQEKDSLLAVIRDWMGHMTSAEQIRMVSAGLEISTGGRLWKLAWPRKGVTA